MRCCKRDLAAFVSALFACGISLHADPATSAPNLSPATQALNSQMQNLSDQARALLDIQLGDLVKQVVTAANKGNGEYVINAITQQYKDAGEKVIKVYAPPGASLDKQVVKDFNTYSIVQIDKVMIEKDVAFVQAKIAYHPDALPEIVKGEKESASDGTGDSGNLWGDMGGTSSANQREKMEQASLRTIWLSSRANGKFIPPFFR